MTWEQAAYAVVAGACLAAGTVMVLRRLSVTAGVLLVAAGGVGLVSAWLMAGDRPDAVGGTGLLLALLVLLPAALWAYPQPRWRHPVDFVLGVLLIAPGVAAGANAQQPNVVASMVALAAVVLVAQTWWRLEAADAAERRALLWVSLALAGSILLSGVLLFTLVDPNGPVVAATLCLYASVPVSMLVGVLRPDVVDVRGVVVHGVVLCVLGLGYVAAFVGVVAIAELLGAAKLAPAGLAVIGLLGAIAFHPAEVQLRTVIDQMLFGDRPDPLDAATRVLDRMSGDPAAALLLIRDSLALPFLALRRDGATIATSGTDVAHTRSVRVATPEGGDAEVVVGMRAGDLRLPDSDAKVLRLVAPLVLQIVRSGQLAADVQSSRESAITSIAEERRRLRRDLHDGLGPALTGVAFSLDAAGNYLDTDVDAARQLLLGARHDTTDAIRQIRGLVYGMRPPALDELGLGPALSQQSAGIRRVDGGLLPVVVTVDETLPELSAAVEVAAYRIVMEALTNIARHAPGASAAVTLRVQDGCLEVDVTDDAGPGSAWTPGVGIASMRERAAEVGGTLHVGPSAQGGRVQARLPFPR